jgi:hypothetical protein
VFSICQRILETMGAKPASRRLLHNGMRHLHAGYRSTSYMPLFESSAA